MDALIFLAVVGLILTTWLLLSGRLKLPGQPGYVDPDLLRAAKGDRALALRLIEQAKLKYPGQSERWYVEKVIYDLGRDHGVARPPRGRSNLSSLSTREAGQKLFLLGAVLWVFNNLVNTIRTLFRR